jgi:hypothetical protein
MFRVGRFLRTFQETDGDAISGASVEIRRQGASVNGIQSKTSGQTVDVDDIGAIRIDDTVEVWRSGTTQVSSSGGTNQFTVTDVSYTGQTVTLSNFSGTLSLADEDRISVVSPAPTLYNDAARDETISGNVLTTSSTGRVECWLAGGFYDMKVSGSTAETTLYIDEHVSVAYTFNVRDARYGALGDGTTDDTAAIQRALDEAYEDGAEGNGGIVEFPPGIYMISSQLTVPGSRLILRGAGNRASVIRATTGFTFNGTTTAMVRLGDGSTDTYSDLQYLAVDCNNVANSICFYSTNMQEGAGAIGCRFARYRVKGVFADTAFGNQNYRFRDCEFSPSASGSTAIGMDLNAGGRPIIEGITFNPYDGATLQAGPAIRVPSGTGGMWRIENINIEDHTNGIRISATGATGKVENVNINTVTTSFQIDAGCNGWKLWNVPGQIVDNTTGGNGTFTCNAGTLIVLGNDGTGASTKFILSGDPDAASRLVSPTKFLKDVVFNTRADIASASSIDVGDGNYFNITGTTAISTITHAGAADNGRPLLLRCNAAAAPLFTTGGNLNLPDGPICVAAGDYVLFQGTSSGWDAIRYPIVRKVGPPVTGDFTTQTNCAFVSAEGSDTVGSVILNPSSTSFSIVYTFKAGTYTTAPRYMVTLTPVDTSATPAHAITSSSIAATTLTVAMKVTDDAINYRLSWVIL